MSTYTTSKSVYVSQEKHSINGKSGNGFNVVLPSRTGVTGFNLCTNSGLFRGINNHRIHPSQQRNFSSVVHLFQQNFRVSAEEAAAAAPVETAAATTTEGAAEVVESADGVPADALEGVQYIPLPPTPVVESVEPLVLNALGEASLKSLGLGGWSPIGLMQQLIELIHVTCDVPWWLSIVITTVVIRASMLPVVVLSQRAAANLANCSPRMQALQKKVSDAKAAQDNILASKHTTELMRFMQDNKINPLKGALMPMVQMPVFMCMFFGLRRMANLPVLSMTTGGLFWWTDLTVSDPYYLLPLLTCGTMFLTIQMAMDQQKMAATSDGMNLMVKLIKFIPFITLPIMAQFPSALTCYWLTTNIISLIQGPTLKVPAVRKALNIPLLVQHPKKALPLTRKAEKKSLKQTMTDAYKGFKKGNKRGVVDRHRLDEERRYKAATGPVPRTFKQDPTKGQL